MADAERGEDRGDAAATAALERIARSVLAFACRDRRVTEIGAFLAVINEKLDIPWLSGAHPRLPAARDERFVAESLRELRTHFAAARRKLRFEYFEALHPRLGSMLEGAGFIRKSRQPIMTCGKADLAAEMSTVTSTVPRAGIRLQALAPGDSRDLLETFMEVRDRAFGEVTQTAQAGPLIEVLRRDLAAGCVTACLAFLEGVPAGAGALQSAQGVSELAGIATLPEHRRRGVATEVSAWLTRAHYDAGGRLAWLTAGDDAAERVYQRLGFRQTGAYQLGYEDA